MNTVTGREIEWSGIPAVVPTQAIARLEETLGPIIDRTNPALTPGTRLALAVGSALIAACALIDNGRLTIATPGLDEIEPADIEHHA